MLRKTILVITAAVLVLSLCACQPNPGSDIVIQKDGDLPEATGNGGDSIGGYTAPAEWKEDISYDNSAIKIKMDAAVEYPAAPKMSSYECSGAVFSQETLDTMIAEFFGDATIYDGDAPQTKEEIQEQILSLQLDIENIRNGNSDSIVDPDFMEEWVKELQEELPDAPDTVEKTPVVTTIADMEPDEYGIKGFYGRAEVPEKGTWHINMLLQNPKTSGPSVYISQDRFYLLDTVDSEEANQDKSPTREEAARQAEALLDRFGITGMHLFSTRFAKQTTGGGDAEESDTYGYNLTYVRDVDGITCLDWVAYAAASSSDATEAAPEGGQFSRMPINECIKIGITKNGINHFSWEGHFDVGEKITDNVALLPFDEIQSSFKDYMLFTYSYLDDPDIIQEIKDPEKYQTMYVYSVKLGYAVTAVKDNPNRMMLTPVWNFYSYWMDENGVKEYNWQPCMSINAANGGTV